MSHRSTASIVLLALMCAAGAQAQVYTPQAMVTPAAAAAAAAAPGGGVTRAKVSYVLDSIAPAIDSKTMDFHYNTHYKAYVDNMNKALGEAGAPPGAKTADLTTLVSNVKTYSGDFFNAARNQGGSAWNHALYFKHLAPAGSANADPKASLSKDLSAAIDSTFGSLDKLQAELTTAATKVFGSGWAWLCVTGGNKLAITSTPNQDNPLMGSLPNTPPVKHAGCTPILGIDVWEHSYYLKHGPKRPAYLRDFFTVVDWKAVSDNYANAKSGKVQALVA